MRITADVEIINFLLPSFNMKAKGRSVKGQLSVGYKPGHKDDGPYLMVCTKQHSAGQFFKLKGNIEKCFTKFLSEGKATIRFKEPPNDICINKADAVQLKALLNVARLAFQGNSLDKVTLTPLAPATNKQLDKLKTRLSIQNRKDYPITTNFPAFLESLVVNHITMKKIDTRIFKLRHLRILDLSHNSLHTLPENFDSLEHLAELNLRENQLTNIPKSFCSGKLKSSLKLLDLRDNRINFLQSYFCDLQSLVTLKLDSNDLVCLPVFIGCMRRLKYLSVSGNQLRSVPASFTQMNLETLDLHSNPFLDPDQSSVIDRLRCPSLLESAARVILKHRVAHTAEDVGPLMSYLSSAHSCLCGGFCFQSHVHYLSKLDMSRVSATFTALAQVHCKHAPCEAFLCSKKCLKYYQQNPYAAIWRNF